MIAAVLALIGVRQSRTYPKFRLADLKRKKLAAKTKSEDRTHVDQAGVGGSRNNLGMKEVFRSSPVILVLFMSSFLIMGSNQSISPIISLYVKSMKIEEYVVLVSGLIFAFTALGAVIAAPLLGRLGDRRGHLPILLCALFVMGLLHIPQARVNDPWVLMGIRFLTGLCIGGLVPSVQALLRRMTPSGIQGSVFAYNQSANSLGNVTGAMTGGIVAGSFGIPTVFYMVAGVFFLHFILILATFRRINRASRKEWEASA